MSSMTKKFVKQNIKLSLEFDEYLTKHPELYDKIPNGAFVVMTMKYDKKFTADSIAAVKSHHNDNQPIVRAEKLRSEWQLKPLTLGSI